MHIEDQIHISNSKLFKCQLKIEDQIELKILRHLHVPPVLTRPLQQDPSLSSSVRCCFQLLIGRKKSYKRVEKVVDFKAKHPEFNPPSVKSFLTQEEQKILDK